MIAAGTRPCLDDGELGIAVLTAERRHGAAPTGLALTQWSTPTFTVEADGPVAAGVDGEAVTLEPPVRFESRPGVLRVRIARAHPGVTIALTGGHAIAAATETMLQRDLALSGTLAMVLASVVFVAVFRRVRALVGRQPHHVVARQEGDLGS